MVRKIHLYTRCAITMATGMPLRGLLHGRRNTYVPHILPTRRPPCTPCPWTSIVPRPPVDLTPTVAYLTAAQRASCPTQRRSYYIRHRPLSPLVKPARPLFPCPLRRGRRRWHAFLHRLDSFLSPIIVMAQPHPNVTFDIVSH